MFLRRFLPVLKPFQYDVYCSNRPSMLNYLIQQFSCWKCGCRNENSSQCSSCQAILDHTKINYFELFGLKPSFEVDTVAIISKYHKLQIQFHPDKYSNENEEEKAVSANFSTLVNKAYSTLTNPLSRAIYILELNNIPLELTSSKNQLLLNNILELSDFISRASCEGHFSKASKTITSEMQKLNRQATTAFKNQDYEAARNVVVQMKYYKNLLEKIKERRAHVGLNY